MYSLLKKCFSLCAECICYTMKIFQISVLKKEIFSSEKKELFR